MAKKSPPEKVAEPMRVTVAGRTALIVTWMFEDGTEHEFMYTCPRPLEIEAKDNAECPHCHKTSLTLQAFCGTCGTEFVK